MTCGSVGQRCGPRVSSPARTSTGGASGHRGDSEACDERALAAERECAARGSRWPVLFVEHMAPAADGLAKVLESVDLRAPSVPVWSNVTARVRRIPAPFVRIWSLSDFAGPLGRILQNFPAAGTLEFHESAPGTVLRG